MTPHAPGQSQPFSAFNKEGPAELHVRPCPHPMLCSCHPQTPCMCYLSSLRIPHFQDNSHSCFRAQLNRYSLGKALLDPLPGWGPCWVLPRWTWVSRALPKVESEAGRWFLWEVGDRSAGTSDKVGHFCEHQVPNPRGTPGRLMNHPRPSPRGRKRVLSIDSLVKCSVASFPTYHVCM